MIHLEERLLISSGRDSRFIAGITRLYCVTNADRLTVLELPKPTVQDDVIFPGAAAASFSP